MTHDPKLVGAVSDGIERKLAELRCAVSPATLVIITRAALAAIDATHAIVPRVKGETIVRQEHWSLAERSK